MSDLIEFLQARLDEDERVATSAASVSDGTMDGRVGARWNVIEIEWEGIHVYSRPSGLDKEGGVAPITAHMQRHDPARVMAEVEAKRRLLDRIEALAATLSAAGHTMPSRESADLIDGIVTDLALPYADHPDYRQEWSA